MRKIAANFIYWPGYPLVKNGYIAFGDDGDVKIVDTGGEIHEIAGLEFYGGMIVPDFVCRESRNFQAEEPLLSALDHIFSLHPEHGVKAAIIEGADLSTLTWKTGARIRLL